MEKFQKMLGKMLILLWEVKNNRTFKTINTNEFCQLSKFQQKMIAKRLGMSDEMLHFYNVELWNSSEPVFSSF